jgi:DNA-binding transcriptional MerR regulator
MQTCRSAKWRAGVSVRALRLYVRHGVISSVRRANGHRVFSAQNCRKLQLVVALKRLGLMLAQ